MARRRTAVLISGRGSNLKALLEAAEDAEYPAQIALVISNNAKAPGLDHARAHGVETAVVDHRDHRTRAEFDAAMDARLTEAGCEIVCLAGFMRLLGPAFCAQRAGKILNIHPSLLPAFKGLDIHERVLEAGVRVTGCTVHFVSAEMDAGPIIIQAAVPVHGDDTPERLAARVLAMEHRCYPLALKWVATGRARIDGQRVHIEGVADGRTTFLQPHDG